MLNRYFIVLLILPLMLVANVALAVGEDHQFSIGSTVIFAGYLEKGKTDRDVKLDDIYSYYYKIDTPPKIFPGIAIGYSYNGYSPVSFYTKARYAVSGTAKNTEDPFIVDSASLYYNYFDLGVGIGNVYQISILKVTTGGYISHNRLVSVLETTQDGKSSYSQSTSTSYVYGLAFGVDVKFSKESRHSIQLDATADLGDIDTEHKGKYGLIQPTPEMTFYRLDIGYGYSF